MDVSIVTSLYGSASHLAGFLEQLEADLKFLESRGYSAESIIVSNAPDRREQRILRTALGSPWWADHSRLIVVPRETLYASWNRGVRASSGSAITFWSVDDWRNPAAMVEGIDLIRQGGDVVRFPWIQAVERRPSRGTVKRMVAIKDADGGNLTDCQSAFCLGPFFMFSRAIFDKLGPFDEQFHIVGDFDWQLRVTSSSTLVQGKRLAGVFFADGANLSGTGSQRALVEHNFLTKRYGLERPVWPLDERARKLSLSYRVDESVVRGTTADWSYDRQWLRYRTWNRVYHRCRRLAGGPVRLARTLTARGRQ